MSDSENLTIRVLESIREELVETNRRVDRLRTETTARLDHLAEGQVRLATEVAGLRGEVSELRGDVGELREEVGGLRGEVGELRGEVRDLRGEVVRQGDRLENAVLTGGALVRDLRVRIERLERHTGLEPA